MQPQPQPRLCVAAPAEQGVVEEFDIQLDLLLKKGFSPNQGIKFEVGDNAVSIHNNRRNYQISL